MDRLDHQPSAGPQYTPEGFERGEVIGWVIEESEGGVEARNRVELAVMELRIPDITLYETLPGNAGTLRGGEHVG